MLQPEHSEWITKLSEKLLEQGTITVKSPTETSFNAQLFHFCSVFSHHLFHWFATCLNLLNKLPNTDTITLKHCIRCADLTTARSCELCGGMRQTEKERHRLEAWSVGPLTWIQSKQAHRGFLLKAATRNYRQQKGDNANATGHFHAVTQFCFGVWFGWFWSLLFNKNHNRCIRMNLRR